MRLNALGQIALNDSGQAVPPWLNDGTVGPYQRNIGGETWQLVTRAGGVVIPVPGVSGGCNECAAGGDQWMRLLQGATPRLSGSHPWSPPNGRVGDIDGNIALTLSDDGLTIRVFVDGLPVRDVQRWQPFGGVRLKGSIATWFEFNRTPNVIAWDVLGNLEVPVQALASTQYTPIVFQAPSGLWVLYQIDELGGVCHRADDPSQGYQFGIPKSVYDPDVVLVGDGCILGWSDDAGQFAPKTLSVPVLGVGMVPLSIPAVIPIGPLGPPLPVGTVVNVADFFVVDDRAWPRGNKPKGDTHGMDLQAVVHKGRPCLWFAKFDTDGFVAYPPGAENIKGALGELLCVDDDPEGHIHLLADCSDSGDASQQRRAEVGTEDDTRWLKKTMQIGRQFGLTTPEHTLTKWDRATGQIVNRIGFNREMWLENVWPKFYCGLEWGECEVLRYVMNNTGWKPGQSGSPDLWVETYYVARKQLPDSSWLVLSWGDWTTDPSSVVFAGGGCVFPDPPGIHSDFWHLGGKRYPPAFPSFIPLPTPPEPPVPPIPVPPPSTSWMLKPGETLKGDQSLLSHDKRFRLLYQLDGNLVNYGPSGPLWANGRNGTSVGFVAMQGDGNLVQYDKSGTPVWATGTAGNPGAWFIVQDDGNPVVYSADGKPLWAAGSVYVPPLVPPGGGGGVPPGPGTADMHKWPKFGGSYATGPWRADFDSSLFASLNRDAGGDLTRIQSFDPWGVAPNGPGQHSGFMPWLRDSSGVFDLSAPDGRYEERLNTYVRTQNAAGATVQISLLELYSWSDRKQGLQWVPDQNLGPFRRNKNGVKWGNPDDPTFLALPDDVMLAWLARICTAVKGLAVCFEAGNEMPEKDMHHRIAAAVRSHFTADWQPNVTTNRQEDTPGQYFNMQIGTKFERIAYHGKESLAYLDEVFPEEPSSRPKTFRDLWPPKSWPEGTVDPKRVIMSSDGCRVNSTIECYDWPVLAEVVKDHLARGFSFEHQSKCKMRPFLENRLDLRADFEVEWLQSLR